MGELSGRPLFDALAERYVDTVNVDVSEWTDEMMVDHIAGVIGEAHRYADRELERLGRLARDVELECAKSRPSKQRLREAVRRARLGG